MGTMLIEDCKDTQKNHTCNFFFGEFGIATSKYAVLPVRLLSCRATSALSVENPLYCHAWRFSCHVERVFCHVERPQGVETSVNRCVTWFAVRPPRLAEQEHGDMLRSLAAALTAFFVPRDVYDFADRG